MIFNLLTQAGMILQTTLYWFEVNQMKSVSHVIDYTFREQIYSYYYTTVWLVTET